MPQKNFFYLYYLFFTSLIIKIFLSFLIKAPSIMGDEAFYFNYAREIWQHRNFFPNPFHVNFYGFLYPLIISPAFLFNNVGFTYTFVKIINCFLTSLTIFPVYFLARKIVNYKKATVIAGISLIIPYFVINSFYVMAENLFYLLFLTSVFLIVKTYNESSKKHEILCGLAIAATILTKTIGLILLLAYLLLNIKSIKKRSVTLISICALIIPCYLVRCSSWGVNVGGVGGITPVNALKGVQTGSTIGTDIIIMTLSHTGYLILSTGIIFFVLSLAMFFDSQKRHDNSKLAYLSNLTWLICVITLVTVGLFTNHDGRIIGRYVDYTIPLFLILGSVYIFRYTSRKKNQIFWSFAFCILPIITMYGFEMGEITGIRGYKSSIGIYTILIIILLGYLLFINTYTPKSKKFVYKITVLWIVIFFILGCNYSFGFLKDGSTRSYELSILVNDKDDILSNTEDATSNWWNKYSIYFWTGEFHGELPLPEP